MKFGGYQSNVNVNTAAPHVTAPSNPLAYGAGGAGWNAAGRALGQIGAVVEKKQEEDDTQDLLDARNKIMTSLTQQMYNSENGLFTTGYGENAKGLTDRVTEAVRTTTNDILKDYNGRVQQAARKHLSDNMYNLQRMAASRESSEAVKMKGVRYEEGLKNGAQMCGLNYNNDDMIRTQLSYGLQLTTAMGKDLGMTGEQIATRQRAVYTENIGNAVQSAINADDYARARQLLNEYKTDMDNGTWAKLDNVVSKQQEKVDTYNAANQIYSETGGDIYAVREMAEAACTKDNGYFDVDKYDRIIARVNALAAQDKKAERAGQRAARQRISEDVAGLMSPEELEDYRAEHEGEWSEDEKYWYGISIDLQQKMYNAARHGYKETNASADKQKADIFGLTLQNGENLSPKQWITYSNAVERLYENGRMTAQDEEAINTYGGNEAINGALTDIINTYGPAGGYNYLIKRDFPDGAAKLMIARIAPGFMTRSTDWDEAIGEKPSYEADDELTD